MRHIADRFTVVLDANVLYPFLVRDVLLSMAHAGLFRARWSLAITDEWASNLKRNRPDKADQIDRTVCVMNNAFPESIVNGFEHIIESLSLPDPDDRHVLAAAIQADAQHIITNNLEDFPVEELGRYGIEAKPPDDFILSTFELYPSDTAAALRRMRRRYENPPITKNSLVFHLAANGLAKTASVLKPHIESL